VREAHAWPQVKEARMDALDKAFADCVRLTRIKLFVDAHYDEPFSLQAAARLAGLEKTYFCKYFRRKTGVGYRAWLSRVRVEHALALLRERKHPITRIAFDVGFADLRTFERAFHRHTGQCAQALRKQLTSAALRRNTG
jgi:transcriptional regulator GlxA family with amidase domain